MQDPIDANALYDPKVSVLREMTTTRAHPGHLHAFNVQWRIVLKYKTSFIPLTFTNQHNLKQLGQTTVSWPCTNSLISKVSTIETLIALIWLRIYWDFIVEHFVIKKWCLLQENISNWTENLVKIYIHFSLRQKGLILPKKLKLFNSAVSVLRRTGHFLKQ